MTLHLVVLPEALVLTLVRPDVMSVTANIVFEEFSDVGRFVLPDKLTLPVLLSVTVAPFVARSIWPSLHTVAVLDIFDPLAIVDCPIRAFEPSVAMSSIVDPITEVSVSICMDQSASPTGFVATPLSLVDGAIWPDLETNSGPLLQVLSPLTLIDGAILEHKGTLVDKICVRWKSDIALVNV